MKRFKIESRLYFAAGSLYTDAIEQLLIEGGITDYDIETSSLTFATDREDWEIGTDYLTVTPGSATQGEMAYNAAYMNNSGTIVCSVYEPPATVNIDFTYNADEHSIIGPNYTKENDYHSKSNVFTVICSNPDLAAPLTATSENDDADSPFNTTNVGRILFVSHVDNTANITALQAKADEIKFKSLLSDEEVTFDTASRTFCI